jgi:hypothetical protein
VDELAGLAWDLDGYSCAVYGLIILVLWTMVLLGSLYGNGMKFMSLIVRILFLFHGGRRASSPAWQLAFAVSTL